MNRGGGGGGFRSRWRVGAGAAAIGLLAASGGVTAPAGHGTGGLPPIVFVSRHPLPGVPLVPGLGPHQRALAPGGSLMLRDAGGRVRELLPAGALWDCASPAVAPDGRRIAFAGTAGPDSAWRIYVVNLDGRGLAAVTGPARGFELPPMPALATDPALDLSRFDDLEPCWVGDHLLCFASTRFPQRAQYAALSVTNLHLVRDDGSGLRRITSERNGAADPVYDPGSGAIVYARWWFNRWQAAVSGAVTTDRARALPRDSINTWQLVAIRPNAHGPKLAAGSLSSRLDAMGVEPALAPDGGIVATYALNLGLSPRPGGTGIHRLDRRGGPTRWIAGAIVPEHGGDPYRNTLGLAAPSACAPAVLPDGRILMSYDPGARGDYGLWIVGRDGAPEPLYDRPGKLELDAAPVLARRLPGRGWSRDPGIAPAAERALARGDLADPALGTFTFDCLDVFASGGLAGAPARAAGLTLRFFAALPRFDRAGGDTAVMLREVPVGRHGAIRATGLPAGVPMFEQLADAAGHPLVTAHGPAHVAGLNAGTAGTVTRCVGCHTGHSRLPVPRGR